MATASFFFLIYPFKFQLKIFLDVCLAKLDMHVNSFCSVNGKKEGIFFGWGTTIWIFESPYQL